MKGMGIYTKDKWRRRLATLPDRLSWIAMATIFAYVMIHLWVWHARTVIYAAQLQRWQGE
jgi:hypothetical protein